jgi:hypothetical protein
MENYQKMEKIGEGSLSTMLTLSFTNNTIQERMESSTKPET